MVASRQKGLYKIIVECWGEKREEGRVYCSDGYIVFDTRRKRHQMFTNVNRQIGAGDFRRAWNLHNQHIGKLFIGKLLYLTTGYTPKDVFERDNTHADVLSAENTGIQT